MDGHTYLRNHDLSAEHLMLNLGQAASEIRAQSPGQARNAVTLVKQGGMSVVLVHLQPGGSLQEHSTPGAATVQVLSGHVLIRFEGETLDVEVDGLVAFSSEARHSVEAVDNSILLLTLNQ